MVELLRKDQKVENTWDLESIFKTNEDFWNQFKEVEELIPQIQSYKGKVKEGAKALLEVFKAEEDMMLKVEQLTIYAFLRKDQDSTNAEYGELYAKTMNLNSKFYAEWSFLKPELLSIDEDVLLGYVEELDELKVYRFELEKINKKRRHTLDPEQEKIIAMATLASTLGGNLKRKKYYADVYKYTSTRNNALSNNLIPEEVYDNLVSVVNEKIPALQRYYELHKRAKGLEDFRLYDRSVSMVKGEPIKFTFEEARDIVLEAVKPMGEEYVNDMRKAFTERWIDIYPNKGKRSGAYSWGGYTTKPFILLNFDGTLNDVYTLIHELGHSMHSYYTRKNQPYVYGSYSIFVAEVASTCNEALLTEYLYNKFEKEGNKNGMLRVLNQALSGFVGTVYRQTQFAEFEHKINQQLQNGGAITAEYLNTEYFNVVKKYYGDVFTYDEDIKYEWSRVPHFYYNYYVYQYATGYSAAQALSKLILEDSKNAKVYIDEFLSKGNSDYPIEVLKNAGVDMSKPDAIELALQDFEEKIEKFEKLYF